MLFIVGNWLQKKEREVYKLVTAAGATLLLLLWPTAAATIIATITFAHPIVGAADCCRWILVLILVIEKSQLKSSSLNSEWPVAVISFSFCSVLYIVIVTSLIISSFPISWLIRQLFWGLMNGNFCIETVTVGFFLHVWIWWKIHQTTKVCSSVLLMGNFLKIWFIWSSRKKLISLVTYAVYLFIFCASATVIGTFWHFHWFYRNKSFFFFFFL